MSKTKTTGALSPYKQLKETALDLELKNTVQQETIYDLQKVNENLGFERTQVSKNLDLALATNRALREQVDLYAAALEGAQKKISTLVDFLGASLKNAAIDAHEARAQEIRTSQRHEAIVGLIQTLGGTAAEG